MANGTRFELTLWPSDTDIFSRTQMDTSHQLIEDLGAIFRQGAIGTRGEATRWTKSFFYDQTNGVLYFSNGTQWVKPTDFGLTASITKVDPEVAKAAGSSDQAARIDHQHDTPPWGSAPVAVGTSATGGALDEFARIDHRHVIGEDAVVAGTIATGAIDSSLTFVAGVVDTAALDDEAVTKVKISADQRNPAGAIMAYAGTTAPDGWLLCDGASKLVSEFNDLHTAIGYQYGGSGLNFNVPDLRGRVPVGLDNMGGTDAGRLSVANTRGGSGGTETHTLTSAQIPAHSHPNTLTSATVASSTHKHAEGNLATAIGAVNSDTSTIGYQAGSTQPSGRGPSSVTNYVATELSIYNGGFGPLSFTHYTRVYGDTSNNATFTTVGISNENNTGGGGSHNNMQPYLLINYIIKT